jgi:sugar O-acyltransferase (sialic acid O-acetyltransferase NeuD family)
MIKRAIIGNGGHAKEVKAQMQEDLLSFVDEEFCDKNSLPISEFNPEEYEVLIAVGDSNKRLELFRKLPKSTKYFNFIHPSAQLFGNVKIGNGCFIGANCILTTDIIIGDHCLLNRGNQIGHDCKIGDFFSMMPGSIISGNCVIGDNVYIGSNSSIKQGVEIYNNVTIGLNSGVIYDIQFSGVYGGVPARMIK